MKTTVNQRIKEFRAETGLNQTQFAVKAGLSLPTISSIESNNAEVSGKTIKAICKAFNANETWINTGKGDMFSDKPLQVIHSEPNPWRDALVQELKEEIAYLRDLLKMSVGGGKGTAANFRKTSDVAKAYQLRIVA